jgi:hypothetical protein
MEHQTEMKMVLVIWAWSADGLGCGYYCGVVVMV